MKNQHVIYVTKKDILQKTVGIRSTIKRETTLKGGLNKYTNTKNQKNEINFIEYPQNNTSNYDNINYDDLRPLIEGGLNFIEIENKNNKTLNQTPINNNTSIWYYDTGSYNHIVNDKNLLKDFKQEKIYLKCANNTLLEFEGYGTFEFNINEYSNYIKYYIQKTLPKICLARLNLPN